MNSMKEREYDIAVASSRLSKKWKNKKMSWRDIVKACSETTYTRETVAEYGRMTRDEQSNIKDVGGFVGGYLSEGTRKTDNVKWRSVATLDIDYGTSDVWDDFTMGFDCAAIMYSTHKHTPEKPRYRLVIPFSRDVAPDEYEPLCRLIARDLGIELFDTTTYQLPRLFYWPSTSKDGEFVFHEQQGSPIDVDEILGSYVDYRDASQWPISSRESEAVAREIRKAGDPTEKPGLIGAFCRQYSIEEAIDKFLQDVYEPTATEGRYTYRKGSVAGGLVCYEGKFAYSHHETDPTSRTLCNAFDLCRVHLFGDLDEGSRVTDVTRLPSYSRMQDMVADDGEVRKRLTMERRANVESDFEDIDTKDEDGGEWMKGLDYDRSGKIKSTTSNMMLVMENDPNLKGRMWRDLFSGFDIVVGGLPWDKKATQWGNSDDSNLRVYLDNVYEITGKDKIYDAKEAVLTKNTRHPIREYLNSLEWDGVERLDRLIIDYIGAEDTRLNREMTRKHFTAAVARVFRPGCKYDHCLILTGEEGIGKSTLFSVMGGEWFSDSLVTMEGKEGMDQARGGWIIELSELGSVKRSDVEQVKSYISRQEDVYRPAYGRVVERHPRQCVFCGTTNETYFLKGDTGNRRFWVIEVNKELRKNGGFREALEADRDQLWAEAVVRFKRGERLYLDPEMEREAREAQTRYNDDADDPLRSELEQFLDRKLPPDWGTYDLNRRRAYYKNPDPLEAEATVTRDRFCAPEFIREFLGRDMSDSQYKFLARKVCGYMRKFEGWEEAKLVNHVQALYGRQKGFIRKADFNVTEDDI